MQQQSTATAVLGGRLTPMDRLQIRDRLQDIWRGNVEEITRLAVRFHSDNGDEEGYDEESAVSRDLAQARFQLVETEAAMQRLDLPGYGDCEQCARAIAVEDLFVMPQRRCCADCETGRRG